MKNNLIFLSMLFFIIFSCNKEDTVKVTSEKDIFLVTESLRYSLGNMPVEGSINISNQATQFSVSEIELDTIEGGVYYIYVPLSSFKGTDYVEITRQDSNGTELIRKHIISLELTVE